MANTKRQDPNRDNFTTIYNDDNYNDKDFDFNFYELRVAATVKLQGDDKQRKQVISALSKKMEEWIGEHLVDKVDVYVF